MRGSAGDETTAERTRSHRKRLPSFIAAGARLLGIKLIDHMTRLCFAWDYRSAAEY